MSHYIEIKTLKNLYPYQARKIIKTGTVKALLTTGTISTDAKRLLDEAGIIWIEKIPENLFRNLT
ncbi:MAG: hypothetical protein ACRC8Y_00290 [Chroococcales cyanobacterium]